MGQYHAVPSTEAGIVDVRGMNTLQLPLPAHQTQSNWAEEANMGPFMGRLGTPRSHPEFYL